MRSDIEEINIEELLNSVSDAQKNLEDDKKFQNCVSNILEKLSIEDIVFANELAVSRSTVARWKNGKAVPHPAMRIPVYAVLKRWIIKYEQ